MDKPDPLGLLIDATAELLHALRESRRSESLSAQRAARRAEDHVDKLLSRLIADRDGLFD